VAIVPTKWPNTLIGPGEPILLPAISNEVDYEAELGIVVGKRVKGAPPDTALEAVSKAILNGQVMRDSTTANMVFGVAETVSFVSQAITLDPGDLILTGTHAGVGVFRDPKVLLQPGDEITIEIEGLGVGEGETWHSCS
jgi:2-keto-4-pentenoate hydratase/2-oxohepta-3-ene-1,7-dioic acid hydratase in catechol pathway